MNTIGTVRFDFLMRNQVFARELYSRWNSFFAQNFEQVADSLLLKYDVESERVEIDCMELDLGVLYESDFDNNFAVVLKEKMEEALLQWLFNPQVDEIINRTSENTRAFEVLKYFLLNGTLKWDCNEYGNIDELFARVINENSEQLNQFLQTYGHYTSLQQRLVYQLTNTQLERGVHLLEPASAVFICSYVRFLHSKYNDINQPSINKTNYTDTVWLVIYAYMLDRQSSFSDKKTFVAQTILQLATKYNLGYGKLIELITFNLDNYIGKVTIPVELFTILKQLKSELDEQQFKQSYNNAAKFYRTVSNLISGKIAPNITHKNREALINILSKAESCRLFIRHLTESEIVNLLPVVAPNDTDFILQTVHILDVQKTQGTLQGKAGGEYRLLKWQIILPILLEKKSGLNRFYFVERVFKSVASHYNCTVFDLLAFILNDKKTVAQIDEELLNILNQLHIQYRTDKVKSRSHPVDNNIFAVIGNAIDANNALSDTEIKQITKHFANTLFCKKLINTISEADKYSLTKLLYTAQGELITAYARNLDSLYDKGALEGKAGGEFKNLKWYFIFAVLFGTQNQVFNKKQFVLNALNQLVARYQIGLATLLKYFKVDGILPKTAHFTEISNIINELYTEQLKIEKRPATKQISESKQSKSTKKGEQEKKVMHTQNDITSVAQTLYLNNAGMVLLAPFLPRLFSMLSLIEANKFIDVDAQIKALYLMQYAAFGHTDFPEHELTLNKLLTGFETSRPIPRNIELTSDETDTVNSMLQGVLQNWAKLKSTSVEGLREGFLQRNGKLEDTGDMYTITVEEKAYDMLLDSVTWNFRTIKYSWMSKPIQVKWR